MDQERKDQEPVTIALTRDLVTDRERLQELVFSTHLSSSTPITLVLPDGQEQTYLSRKAVLFMIDYATVYYQTEVPTMDYFQMMQCLMEQARKEEELRQMMGLLAAKLKEYYG